MFSLLILVLALVPAIIYIIKGSIKMDKSAWNDQAGKSEGRSTLTKGIVIAVIGLLVSLFQPFALERVDSGYSGIKVNLTGNDRGVSDYQYKTGWVVYNTWTEQLLEFPTYQQHIEYDEQIVITKGGFSATIKPSFNYSLKEESIGDMFVNLRRPITEIEQGWLRNAIVSSVNDVANKWEVDAIFNNREKFESAIIAECNKRLDKWFVVSQLRTNIIPPTSLQAAIEGKTKAIQEAQAEEQKALVAIANGKKLIAQAQADSAQRVIRAHGLASAVLIEAKAEAEAIRIKQKEVSLTYNDYIKAQKWNGQLPTTVLGNSTPMINIK